MSQYPLCLSRPVLYSRDPIRYSRLWCVQCNYNFICLYLAGAYVPVDMITYCTNLFRTHLTRRQTISYVRDHYGIRETTANDIYREALNRIKKFYLVKRPYKKQLHFQQVTDWTKERLPLRISGFSQEIVVEFLSRINFRTTLCIPFASTGVAMETFFRFFAKIYSFDNHPAALQLLRPHHQQHHFYPVRYDQVPHKRYSVVYVDLARCNDTRFLEKLNRKVPVKEDIEKTLVELLYEVPRYEWDRLYPVQDVVKFYTREETPIIAIAYESPLPDNIFYVIQDVLPENYFIREGFTVGGSGILIIAKKKGGEKNA